MAMFKVKMGATVGNQAQNKACFAEYDIPDEVIRQYRTYVETGIAKVLAEAAVIALSSEDPGSALLNKVDS